MAFRERNLHIKILVIAAIASLFTVISADSSEIQSTSGSGHKHLPRIINCPNSLIFNHCSLALYEFKAKHPAGRTISFKLISGPGSINRTTGVWSYSPTIADVRSRQQIVVAVVDEKSGRQGPSCTVYLVFRNARPVFDTAGTTTRSVTPGDSETVSYRAISRDCDPMSSFVSKVDPHPSGTYTFDMSRHIMQFLPDSADAGKTFVFTIGVTDGKDTSYCKTTIVVDARVPYRIKIETEHLAFQGLRQTVDVTIERGSIEMSGYDFLISYDLNALSLVSVIPSPTLYQSPPDGCGWEYFVYRSSPFGNCGVACATGKIRVVSIAETNNGPYSPTCYLPNTPSKLFSIEFIVSDNRTYECQFLPIKFVWFDCGDNTISSKQADELFISRNVWDPVANRDIHDYTAPGGYPTFAGAQDADCFAGNPTRVPTRFIDFVNGGIDIVCYGDYDARGDINLNEIGYEIADAVLFSRYFVAGTNVFTVNLQGQIAATDVNDDDTTLTIEDLVYLYRVNMGDAAPMPKPIPSFAAILQRNGSTLSIDRPVGAAWIWAKGNVTPQLLAPGMDMLYNYDGEKTKILVCGGEAMSDRTLFGDFIKIPAPLLFYDFATYEGFKVDATLDCCWGMRGDVNNDGRTEPNVSDVAALCVYVAGSKSEICLSEADVNGDGVVNVTDIAYLTKYIYNKGPAPVACP